MSIKGFFVAVTFEGHDFFFVGIRVKRLDFY
jgi:hypothetical protein